MVVQPTADFLVGGSNPGQVNMLAAPPMAFDWQGFEPPTAKTAARCATILPCVAAVRMGIPIAPCLGVCYVNDPKKGGYTTPTPALALTTSLRGDWYFTKDSVTGAPLPDPPPLLRGAPTTPPPPPRKPIFPSPNEWHNDMQTAFVG